MGPHGLGHCNRADIEHLGGAPGLGLVLGLYEGLVLGPHEGLGLVLELMRLWC